jgi:5-dehydro-2-deoxygluconokinase
MTRIGFDRTHYILPFDHSGSAYARMFDWKGPLTEAQRENITATKRMIYDAFLRAGGLGIPRDKEGILVDEQFGGDIIRDANKRGFSTCCPLENPDQQKNIESLHPTFWKILVRYNPEADKPLNTRQTDRLRRFSDRLHQSSPSSFMCELRKRELS